MTLESNIAIVKNIDDQLFATDYFESYLYDISKVATSVTDASSPDAIDLATAITLVNELKTQVNALLAALRESGKLDA